MRVRCDTGIQYALLRDVDPQALKRQVEQQIRAAEDRNKVFLENAARRDIDAYVNSTINPKPVMLKREDNISLVKLKSFGLRVKRTEANI